MDSANSSKAFQSLTSSHITIKSALNPQQRLIQSLYAEVGIHLEEKTFIAIWRLVDLGIPPEEISKLLCDIAKYSKRK